MWYIAWIVVAVIAVFAGRKAALSICEQTQQ